jgi:hypothetical protein
MRGMHIDRSGAITPGARTLMDGGYAFVHFLLRDQLGNGQEFALDLARLIAEAAAALANATKEYS